MQMTRHGEGACIQMADHEAQVADLQAQIDALRSEAQRLQWKLITPENLPKVGDEVLSLRKRDWAIQRLTTEDDDWIEIMMLTDAAPNIEYFRPINTPARAEAPQEKQ